MVARNPCQENYPANAQVSAGVSKPSMDLNCASGCIRSTARATAHLREADPGVVKQEVAQWLYIPCCIEAGPNGPVAAYPLPQLGQMA